MQQQKLKVKGKKCYVIIVCMVLLLTKNKSCTTKKLNCVSTLRGYCIRESSMCVVIYWKIRIKFKINIQVTEVTEILL